MAFLVDERQSPIILIISYLIILLIVFSFGKIIYNLYFHPLQSYPGPILSRATRLHYVYHQLKGELPQHTKALHDYYGEAVRIAPDELSYNSAQAYEDVYNRRYKHLKGGFEKDKTWYSQSINKIPVIVTAESEDHSRLRRILAFAFSDQALRRQEPLIRAQVDILLSKLHREVEAAKDNIINLYPWLSSATMDIISDLSFGRSLGCLETTSSESVHPWVNMIAGHMKQGLYVQAWRRLPAWISRSSLAEAVLKAMSSQWREQFHMTSQLAKERVLGGATDREDFISHMLRENDDTGMTLPEMEISASIFMTAGSETSSSLLVGCLYYVMRSPLIWSRLCTEIRQRFAKESDMTFGELQKLEYLNAVIEESLRLYTPVPTTFPRTVPLPGETICGQWVPGGYNVGVNPYAAAVSEINFTNPKSFRPERWLGDEQFAADVKRAHQPFAIGPRNCVGKNLAYAESRLILSRIIWNFDMTLDRESENWIEGQKVFVSCVKKPLKVRMTKVVR